jgi:hypothetical protein
MIATMIVVNIYVHLSIQLIIFKKRNKLKD